jgi:hypothetical protein
VIDNELEIADKGLEHHDENGGGAEGAEGAEDFRERGDAHEQGDGKGGKIAAADEGGGGGGVAVL